MRDTIMGVADSRVQQLTKAFLIHTKIIQSQWWHRAAVCVDSHYSNTSGVMLVDHLTAVMENVDTIFCDTTNAFLQHLFAFAGSLQVNKESLWQELKIIALLHDIGKTEEDKSQWILHPIHGFPTIKRHSVVSVCAARAILEEESWLLHEEKRLIYSVIEEHDVSYGLFKEYKATGAEPSFERWRALNDQIHPQPGRGLLYLLIFKLADIHGHANIEDVTWFFKRVHHDYFKRFGMHLPLPSEQDIR